MTKINEIDEFIREALKIGKKRPEIEAVLQEAGWQNEQIARAFKAYSDVDFPIPVPKPRIFVSPKLFFLNLFYFIVLYLNIFNVIDILFDIIEYYLPSHYTYPSYNFYIQSNISVLILSLPLFYYISKFLSNMTQKTGHFVPRIRLVMIYFSMFIGACILLGSACSLIYYVLIWELDIAFVLKILILCLTSLGFHFYFKNEIKENEAEA